jgi:hypothetical protein
MKLPVATVRLPLDKKLPISLIKKLVKAKRRRKIEFAAKEKLEIVLSAPVPAFHSRVSVGQARRGGRKGFKQTPPCLDA